MEPGKLLQASFLLLVLCCAGRASGQENVGVGVSFEPTRLFLVGESILTTYITTPVSVYVPLTFNSMYRLEPDFGFISFGSQRTYDISTDRNEGSRVGLYFVSSKTSYSGQFASTSTRITETDLMVGLSVGGEYFASSQFSFGAEAQANYISFGKPRETRTPLEPDRLKDRSQHMYSSNALFFLRLYF